MALARASELTVDFTIGRHLMPSRRTLLRAVDRVSIEIDPGETLGLVGESGSGKSTLGRALLRLIPASSGHLELMGEEVDLHRRLPTRLRKRVQMVFQDPYSSLNPAMTIGEAVGEPLVVHGEARRADLAARIEEALEQVGLRHEHGSRYPHEFSGGQRQRVAIARAMILRPDLVVCDEPVSALDVSIQGQIVNLLAEIQAKLDTSYLFIAHDLSVVRHISHRIAVMYLAQVVETGPTARVYDSPAHPYTAALLSAVPPTHPRKSGLHGRVLLEGEIPSVLEPPSGCRFRTRCPFAMEVCAEREPEPYPVEGGGSAACHLHTKGPALGGGSVLELIREHASVAGGPMRANESDNQEGQ